MNEKDSLLLKVYARFPGVLGMGSHSKGLDLGLGERVKGDGQHDCRSDRRYASRSGRLRRSVCIEELLVYVSRTTSLILCLLAESRLRLDRLVFRYRSKKFGISDVLRSLRNGFLRFVAPSQRRVESRRTAVGLAPLESTNSGW